jgi:anaerobic selenocysteine-containing dehydrogenase
MTSFVHPSSPSGILGPVMQSTACILCSRNCGIQVEVEDRRLVRIRGDAGHPLTAGYLCQKAARLDHYQNHADRLEHPLKRQADGTFARATWDEAIADVARRLVALRERHGGRALAFYGGGGQGNHLGGVAAAALIHGMRTRYHYSALAQEKTGDFWVNGRLFGHQGCHTTEDIEHADLVIFMGTNPWQSHGIPNAREVLQAIARDPKRTMIVIDPVRTETAKLADVHLALRPGTDAQLLAAMLAIVVQEGLADEAFLAARTTGWESVRSVLAGLDADALARQADVDPGVVRDVTRRYARTPAASLRIDLGLQQTLNSTLNSYLEKLLMLATGHFGRRGCNNLHTALVPLARHSAPPGPGSASWTTARTGIAEIARLFPPNVLPEEIDHDGEDRIRGLVVDSANPAMSGADSKAYARALDRLELCVVVDVAFTETARHAHWVLPAATQFEKWEATFFNLDFPRNGFHLRAPVLPPRDGPLPETEIYRRILVAMGELPERFPILEQAARLHRKWPALNLFPAALAATFAFRPALKAYAGVVLQQTLGRALPDGALAAAPLWFAAHRYAAQHAAAVRRAGHRGRTTAELGDALFEAFLTGRSGVVMSIHEYDDVWSLVRYPDRRAHLQIPELLERLRALPTPPAASVDFPLVLIAGERRAYNANTIYRDPRWRRTDPAGRLRMHPDDARAAGLADGAAAVCASARGEVKVEVEITDAVRRGMVTLPHGYGLDYPDGAARTAHGPSINDLTDSRHRDPIAGTPYHKHVPVRVRPA